LALADLSYSGATAGAGISFIEPWFNAMSMKGVTAL